MISIQSLFCLVQMFKRNTPLHMFDFLLNNDIHFFNHLLHETSNKYLKKTSAHIQNRAIRTIKSILIFAVVSL